MTERIKLNDLSSVIDYDSMPVGDSIRTRHGHCKFGNTSVTRTPVGWLMHCFQCGAKGFEQARVAHSISMNPTVVSKSAARSEPAIVPNIIKANYKEGTEAALKIGLNSWEWARLPVYYEEARKRVLFPLTAICNAGPDLYFKQGGWAGRHVGDGGGGLLARKWMVYQHEPEPDSALVYYPLASDRAPAILTDDSVLVLCEDPISAMRIHLAMGSNYLVMAMLGLHIAPRLLEYAAKWPGHVVLWTDGDAPGKLRGEEIKRQLEFLRYNKVTMLTYVNGKDPKHLSRLEIRTHLDSVYKEASYRQESMEEMSSTPT